MSNDSPLMNLDFATQCFAISLTGQSILGLTNSLFILSDSNLTLGLFGFYACFSNQFYALICYVIFSSIFSVIMDIIRIVLWHSELLLSQVSVGLLATLENYYLVILSIGICVKVIAGVFAVALIRKIMSEEYSTRGKRRTEI